MANPRHNGDAAPSRAGYLLAIILAAAGHAGLFAFAIFIAPQLFNKSTRIPPAYTVKIVDNLPAGDLGTHLPRLAPPEPVRVKPIEPAPTKIEPATPKIETPPENDKNAIALNAVTPEPTPTPTPTPEATPEPTIAPTIEKPRRTPRPRHTPAPSPRRTPEPRRAHVHHEPTPHKTPIMVARAEPTHKVEPTHSVNARLQKIREELLRQHLAELAKHGDEGGAETEPSAPSSSGGGPVVANEARAGSGYGVGPGTGSAGIQQDPEFLLYYSSVQDKIKRAWTFTSGSADLTAVVDYAIGPDGALTEVKIAKSSKDPAFDESVLRAIRSAAPFAPPPEKYRAQWAGGVEATFRLGDLKS